MPPRFAAGRSRRKLVCSGALLASLVAGCPGAEEREPPIFTVLSDSLLTFEGWASSVIVETDRRARFSVMDPEDQPRGAAVAENAGRIEIPFDASGLPASGAFLRVVGVSDSGGKAERTVSVSNGFEGLTALNDPPLAILDAALLTDGRLAVVAADGLYLQSAEGSTQFESLDSSDTPLSIAAGADGDFFVGGQEDIVVHYDEQGEECDRITLIETMAATNTLERSTRVVDLDSRFGSGTIEVVGAHELGFSGFNFSDLDCNDGCGAESECTLDPAHGFSTGTCLRVNAPSNFGGTAVALDAPIDADDPPLVYSGGYTFNVWVTVQGPNMCVDLETDGAAMHPLSGIVVSGERIWASIDSTVGSSTSESGQRGIYAIERGFNKGPTPSVPPTDHYGNLPDDRIRCLAEAVLDSNDEQGVWFGTASGVGLLRVDEAGGSQVDWISGYSLPGRQVSVVIQPPDSPSDLWVGTDQGLARLSLP